MFKVVEREMARQFYMGARVPAFIRRWSAFPKTESAGVDLAADNAEHDLCKAEVSAYTNSTNLLALYDSRSSKGNFITDVSGHTKLDLCMEGLPLGWNHKDFVSVANNKAWDHHSINPGMDAAQRATSDFAEGASDALNAVKPAGMTSVTLVHGSSAVEQAIFAAMAQRGNGQRQTALRFSNSSCSNSILLSGLMGLDWPEVEYPTTAQEEERALEGARQALAEGNVSAVVIEPTSARSGHAVSDAFVAQLHGLAQANGAALVVDETNTGCGASGKGFWQYSGAADYVTFGKRTQFTGFYTNEAKQADEMFVAGKMIDLQRHNIIKSAMDSEGLIERVARVGASHLAAAESAASKSGHIHGVRGSGTSLWIDTSSPEELREHLSAHGVLVKANGSHGVMTKPSLTLEDHQAQHLVSALAKFSM